MPGYTTVTTTTDMPIASTCCDGMQCMFPYTSPPEWGACFPYTTTTTWEPEPWNTTTSYPTGNCPVATGSYSDSCEQCKEVSNPNVTEQTNRAYEQSKETGASPRCYLECACKDRKGTYQWTSINEDSCAVVNTYASIRNSDGHLECDVPAPKPLRTTTWGPQPWNTTTTTSGPELWNTTTPSPQLTTSSVTGKCVNATGNYSKSCICSLIENLDGCILDCACLAHTGYWQWTSINTDSCALEVDPKWRSINSLLLVPGIHNSDGHLECDAIWGPHPLRNTAWQPTNTFNSSRPPTPARLRRKWSSRVPEPKQAGSNGFTVMV